MPSDWAVSVLTAIACKAAPFNMGSGSSRHALCPYNRDISAGKNKTREMAEGGQSRTEGAGERGVLAGPSREDWSIAVRASNTK